MKWINRNDDTSHFEDRRGRRSGVRGKFALGGLGAIIVVIISLFLGKDPSQLLGLVSQMTGDPSTEETVDPKQARAFEAEKDFTLGVFNSCNDVWEGIFRDELGKHYRKPTLVAFTDQVQSACGGASSAMGPFYCSGDERVYIDMSFFQELSQRFHAPGDLARAYVTAHEVGHHVQHLLGTSARVHAQHGRVSDKEYNQLSVRLELQADFYAGLWAYYANKQGIIQLEAGDLEDALTAAHAIGDDALQKAAQGYVVPDSFTHGSSEQRMYWFRLGYTTGKFHNGDTFSARLDESR